MRASGEKQSLVRLLINDEEQDDFWGDEEEEDVVVDRMADEDEFLSLSDSFKGISIGSTQQPNNNGLDEDGEDVIVYDTHDETDTSSQDNNPHKKYEQIKRQIEELEKAKIHVERALSLEQPQFRGLNRKRRLKRSYDPLTELDKHKINIDKQLIAKRKELMKVVQAMNKRLDQGSSMDLDGSSGAQDLRASTIFTEEMEKSLLEPPSSGISRKKLKHQEERENLLGNVGYSGAEEVAKEMGGTELLAAAIKRELDDIEIPYEDLVFGQLIGKGAYGEVYIAQWRGVMVAVKRLSLKMRETRHLVLKAFRRELNCLKQTAGDSRIVPLLGACMTEDYCCIIMEYLSGSLHDLIFKEKVSFSLERNVRLLKSIAGGMKYLHSFSPPIIHRDLSTQNILFHPWNNEGKTYIGDFGIALFKEKRTTITNSGNTREIPMSPVGHPRYRAPEVTRNQLFSKRADVYPFGTVIYELLVHQKPFPDLSDSEVSKALADGEIPEIPEWVPRPLRKLMCRCWDPSPKNRPQFSDIVRKLKRLLKKIQQENAALNNTNTNNNNNVDNNQHAQLKMSSGL